MLTSSRQNVPLGLYVGKMGVGEVGVGEKVPNRDRRGDRGERGGEGSRRERGGGSRGERGGGTEGEGSRWGREGKGSRGERGGGIEGGGIEGGGIEGGGRQQLEHYSMIWSRVQLNISVIFSHSLTSCRRTR